MAHKLVFRTHALQRMFERRITVADLEAVLDRGETVEQYPGTSLIRAASTVGVVSNQSSVFSN